MPRNGGGIFSLTSNYEATPGETILAEQHNSPLEDIEQDLNTARPIVAGGTGATTAIGAHDNFSTKGSDVVAAATTDIGASTGQFIHITGTTGITALGTKTAGVVRRVVFDGILTLTHSGTLILPGGANITTAVGDTAEFISEGGGNWRCVGYSRASGRPLAAAIRTITGNDSITLADLGKTILFNSSSAITVTLSAVATLGDGFWCEFKNIGAGAITLDPNSSETIDGQATSIVPTNDCGKVHCTGSVLHTVGRPPVLNLTSGTISAATAAPIDLSAYKLAGFNRFKLLLNSIAPATDGAFLVMDVSNNAGSSYANSGYISPSLSFIAGTIAAYDATSLANFPLTDTTGNAVGEVAFAEIDIEITSTTTRVHSRGAHLTAAGACRGLIMEGWQSTSNVNAIRFYQNAGNMSSGSWQLIGIR